MPRQRSETVNRHSERHNPIGTPQGRTRTDSSQTGTSSNGSSHFSSKSNLRNKNSSNNLNHIPNSPHRSSNFSPAPDRLQHQQYASHHPQGFQSDSTDNSMQIDSVANPPAVLQRMVYGRGGAGQNGHQRERTTTSGSMTPISLEGFPSRDGWDQVHDQYLSRIQLKRDKSLVTPSMYHGTLYNLCLAQGLDETAEQIRLEAGNEQEEEWRGSGVSKWGTNSFQLERIEDVNENSSSKDRSKRYFFLMAGCPVEGWVLINSNEGKAVVAPDSVFSVLNWCHDKSGHGGRDKTHGLLRKYFANVPKELCQTYVKICPTCNNKRHNTMAHVRNAEDGHFEYGQDGEVDMLVDDRTPSVFTGGMPAPPPQDHRHHHHHRQEGGVNINDWSSSMSQQREFHGPRFPFNGQQSSNSLGLETGVPAVAFLPPSPFHSSNSLHQNGMQGHHQHSNQLAYPQLYFQDAPEHLGGSFLHQNAGLGQGVNEVHRGSFSGSGSGSESTGPNTPASQMDLNWPKDMDTTIATPFFGEVGQMDSHAQKSNQFGGKESMGPPPAPFGFQDDQQHRSVSTTYLDFSDAGPSHSTVVKPSMHRANKPAQLDLSSIQNQVMDLENNFQSYGLPTTCSSISTNSEASIYSAVTEPSIQYRPLLDGADEAETGRVSSSELLPRRFDINNPPSSAPPAQSHFFPNAPDDTLREMQEQRSRERAVLSAAAASGKGKHASLNQGFGGNASNEEYLPAHRVATPLSAVPPTTTASFGPTYGAVFGNVVGGTGNLFRGQGRGKDGKIESDLMPVTAYGAPDLTVYLNPAYGIPGMSGESMVKSFSAPGTTSQPAGDEGASQIEPPSKSPNFNPSRVGNGSHFMSAPPDLLRRHSVAVEQAVVPETSSSLVSIGMSSEAAGLGHRSISKTTSQSGAATQAQLLERSWNQGASMDKEARENGHGRERARHESFEPLSAASSETDLKEIAKLNGLSKSQSADGSFYYDASAMHGPVDFTTQLNNNLELNLSMARGIDSSSVQFPQAGDEGMEDASPDGNSSVSNEDMMLSLKNAWLAGTDSTANMMAKAKESFLEKASSLGIGLGFPSVNFNEGNTSTSSESENGDSSRGTIRVLRNSSIQSSHGGRSASSSSTSSGFQPARARCSSTTKVDKADVQVELNGVSKNYNSLTQSPRSSSSAYGSMRSHSRRVSKQTADKTNDENSNVDLLDPNELMSADELNQLLS